MKIDKSEQAELKKITHSPWKTDNPLSYQQMGIWFLCELVPDSPVWNVLYCKRLKGTLNLDFFKQACLKLVRRHAALRTNVVVRDGQPFQRYVDMDGDMVKVEDYRSLDRKARENRVRDLIHCEAQTPIDLKGERLFKIFLIRMGAGETILLINLHHFISDHVSLYAMACDLKNLYNEGFNIEPVLKPLPIEYSDYVLWQRKIFSRQYADEWAEYLDQFKGSLPVIDLPAKSAPGSERSFVAGVEKIVLEKEWIHRLNRFSFKKKVILFSTLLTAYFVLLHKYSRQDDILVATLFSGRDYNKHLLPMVGYFINTVALRVTFGSDPDFEDLLKTVHHKVSDAYAMPNYPFERLMQKIKSGKTFGPTPLFQTAFNVVNFIREPYAYHGIDEETYMEIPRPATPTDLMLEIRDYPDKAEVIFLYSSEMFQKELIADLARHYVNILRRVGAGDPVKLSVLNLLDETERHRILTGWNHTRANFPQDRCLHGLIEDQAEKTPGQVAVAFEDTWLTYEQLNREANRLAGYLIEQGVKPDTLVGLCMERSLEMMVGLLGILKAGGAYVPIDPEYPPDRIDYMLEYSGARIVLGQERCVANLNTSGQQVICLDNPGQRAKIRAYPPDNPGSGPPGPGPENLAYMIYTSGSTGRPKGVLVEHRAIVNRLDWMQKKYPITGHDNVLQKTPFSFDVSVWEFFWPLMTGSRITMARPGGHKDPGYLSALIQKEHVTVLHFVPSMLNAMLASVDWGECKSVRQVFCSGERLSPETVARYYESGNRAALANLYGPTEAAVDVSFWDCRPDRARTIPIGKPIQNTVLHVLDENLLPVPVGVPGELHIGGICLARGYLNQPDLTREKFIKNPFQEDNGERLYKTGDLVRYLYDGNIEYMGRLDHQVKIRGFRIELGEIETVLDQHPDVRESVVMARETRPDENTLVAYVVPDRGQAPDRGALRAHLREKLPEYMVPLFFMVLEKMPLLTNGKVNRHALPMPDQVEIEAMDDRIPPRDLLELRITQIWEAVLGHYPPGVKNRFFEIGDSLQGVRLLARMDREFGVNLPLSVLFQEGTIESMANLVRQGRSPMPDSNLVLIREKQGGIPLFLVHPVGGSVLCYSDLARILDLIGPVYGLQAPGLMDGQEPLKTMDQMADRYLREIRTIQDRGPFYLAGWSFGGSVAYCMAGKLIRAGEPVNGLFLIDTPAYIGDAKPGRMGESLIMTMFVRDLEGFFGRELPVEVDRILEQEQGARMTYIVRMARDHDMLPPEVGVETLSSMFGVYQANLLAAHKYEPEYHQVNVHLFTAADSSGHLKQDPTLGWGGLLGDLLRVHTLPGDHYSIIRKPNVNLLAEQLIARIKESGESSPGRVETSNTV